MPNGKYDMNNCGGLSSDFIGQSWNYPEANYSTRRAIWAAHRDYQQGLLWTMAHDPAMPTAVRTGISEQHLEMTGVCPTILSLLISVLILISRFISRTRYARE